MNILDILILIPVLLFAFNGFRKGFIVSISSIIALISGIYAGIYYADITERYLALYFDLTPNQLNVLAFILTFLIVVIVINLIGKIIQKLFNLIALGFIDRMIGMIFGILKATLVISVLLLIINNYDSQHKIISKELKENSTLYKPVSLFVPNILPMIDLEIWNFDSDAQQKNSYQVI